MSSIFCLEAENGVNASVGQFPIDKKQHKNKAWKTKGIFDWVLPTSQQKVHCQIQLTGKILISFVSWLSLSKSVLQIKWNHARVIVLFLLFDS